MRKKKEPQKDIVKEETAQGEALPVVRISVRRMVEFLLRSGDIDRRAVRAADQEAALAGGRLHRKLQKGAAGDYEAEVSLTSEKEFPDLLLKVEGRADGIIDGNDPDALACIDEIKGMYLDVKALEEPFPLHLAQARCYAAMYAAGSGRKRIGVQVTYGNLENEEIRRFRFEYESEELQKWFEDLVVMYHKWASWQIEHMKARNTSMQGMPFPFPYRKGQKQVAAVVYHTVAEGGQLFLMAPTGVGKTMSCVFPAVRAIGEGCGDRIFYLTAKNETLKSGREAFRILRGRGLDFRTVQITSKDKICPLREPSCTPEDCPYARGHFDRINDAVYELLVTEDFYERELLLSYADEKKVCPFELTLDTASFCDAVLCDYNYVFDPDARLKRFFASGVKGDYIFLIDEAHNLAERGSEMFSASLLKEQVKKKKKAVHDKDKKTEKALAKVNKLLLVMRHETEDAPTGAAVQVPYRLYTPAELHAFLPAVHSLYEAMQDLYQNSDDAVLKEALLDFYFEVRTFTSVSELLGENYRIYTEKTEEGFRLKLYCVNPAEQLSSVTDRGRAAIFFSATLLPVDYYKKQLTTTENAPAVYAPSPFDPANRLILAAADVSTRYSARTPDMFRKIASYISRMARARKGNYFAFFPSYKLMKDVFRVYRQEFDSDDVNWVVQHPGMQEDDREIFLENFYEDPPKSLVGFCVMGGMFAEGLDLTGTKLVGAAVVGAGLPQVSNEREILKSYYDEAGSGFDYAYRYPGMNKVQQAAGRVIRTAADVGVILLLDDRFLEPDYRRLFPREWGSAGICTLGNAAELMREFWDSRSGNGENTGQNDTPPG